MYNLRQWSLILFAAIFSNISFSSETSCQLTSVSKTLSNDFMSSVPFSSKLQNYKKPEEFLADVVTAFKMLSRWGVIPFPNPQESTLKQYAQDIAAELKGDEQWYLHWQTLSSREKLLDLLLPMITRISYGYGINYYNTFRSHIDQATSVAPDDADCKHLMLITSPPSSQSLLIFGVYIMLLTMSCLFVIH